MATENGNRRNDKNSSNNERGSRTSSRNLILIIAICAVSLSNILGFHLMHNDKNYADLAGRAFRERHLEVSSKSASASKPKGEKAGLGSLMVDPAEMFDPAASIAVVERENSDNNEEQEHLVAGLSCSKYGGPEDEFASSEMVFWSDIPSDAKYHSPFRHTEEQDHKYLTFEPDHGGWNNIRMAMETALVMAHAMGRTLVLPPEQQMYLLGKDHFSFNDFFHLDSIALEHDGFDIITMEEFLKKEGITGKLKNTKTGEVMKPPGDQTLWTGTGRKSRELMTLFNYLRDVGYVPKGWNPTNCFAAIPSSTNPADVEELRKTYEDIIRHGKIPDFEEFVGKPTPVDASTEERMREMIASRKNICIYDTEMQQSKLVHFSVDKSIDARLLSHFYAFIFFQDWRVDLWSKRFVRDHVRYVDEIVCAAARVVKAVRERAKKHNPKNVDGVFDSMHVRRGDFQYKKTRLSAEELYSKSKDELTEGGTLYIATDERDKSFFNPLKEKYDVCFLDDFFSEIEGMNSNYYGMLDQLVASKADVFFGTWWSTLSGYINRMRGYYITKNKLDGYLDGTMKSYYFFPEDKKNQMREYQSVKLPIYMREFPTSWLDIDKGIEDIRQIGDRKGGALSKETQ